MGLAPVDDLTGAKALGGTAGLDLVEEDDAVELPPLSASFFFLWSALYWLGYMCMGKDTISYLNFPLTSAPALTP